MRWKLVIIIAIIFPILAISVVKSTHQTKPIAVQLSSNTKTAPVTPKALGTETTSIQPATTAPTAAVKPTESSNPAPVVPTADQNKTKLQALITNTATSRGLVGDQLDAQWICVQKMINSEGFNYDNYDTLLSAPVMQFYMTVPIAKDGTNIYRYFDYQGSCTPVTNPINPAYAN